MTAPPVLAALRLPWEITTPEPPAVTVLPADTETARRLRSIVAPGVVVVTRFVGDKCDLEAAASGVMAGLGKDPVLAYSKRFASPLAAGWLASSDVHTAVVVDPSDYSDVDRNRLADLLAGFGIRTWFAWAQPSVENIYPGVVADGATEVPADVFWATFPTSEPPAPTEPTGGLPRLPRVDGMVFRAACRDLLPPDEFAAVDARFVTLVSELRVTISGHSSPRNPKDLQLLRKLIGAASSTDELILVVRAAQVAFLLEGRHVNVATSALLGAAETLPRRGLSVPQDWWVRLEAYWDPDVPAGVALHHAGVSIDEMCLLTLADVELGGPDKVAVTVADTDESRTCTLSGPAARFVVALTVSRLASGAEADSLLFTTHRAAQITRKFAADRILKAPVFDVGISVDHRLDQRKRTDTYWLDRYGVSLTKFYNEQK